MRLYLNVPYREKDEVKVLGAKWNQKVKRWYIDAKWERYADFSKWILGDSEEAVIATGYIYIIEGVRKCWKCGHLTKVIGLGIAEAVFITLQEDDFQNEYIETYIDPGNELRVGWVDTPDEIPPKLLRYIMENYSVWTGYSKMTGACFANHCDYCGAIQGNWYLFDEPDSPFSSCVADDEQLIEKMSKLKIKGIPIEDDLQLKWGIAFCSNDYVYFDYAQYEELVLSTDPQYECITYEDLYDI